MKNMNNKYKTLNIFLLVLIVIGIGLLFTQDKWVTPLTNYILNLSDNENTKVGSKWTGKIDSVKTDCIFDGICSVTVSNVEVVVVAGMKALEEGEEVGKLVGVDSVGDLQQYVGKYANVFARKIDSQLFTLYGNKDFFIELKK